MRFPRRMVALPVVAALLACGRAAPRATVSLMVDDFGDSVAVGRAAARIVSLNPVTTEILFAIGAGAKVVGRTHWDTYPAAALAATDIGDGMQPNVEAILGVHPDLVVLYASPSNRAAARQLHGAGIATITLRTDHLADFRRAVTWMARAVGDSAAGAVLADSVERSITAVAALPHATPGPSVFWHLWDSPLLTAGKGSFLAELVTIAGGRNVFDDLEAPSPQVAMEELVRRDPDYIVAGPASAAKLRANPAWRALRAVREGRVIVPDTALVIRPGVRLGEAARELHTLLVPVAPR